MESTKKESKDKMVWIGHAGFRFCNNHLCSGDAAFKQDLGALVVSPGRFPERSPRESPRGLPGGALGAI